MTFKEAAKFILGQKTGPVGYTELTKEALARKLISDAGKTPARTMNAQINRDIKAKGVLSDFVKAGNGKYELNKKRAQLQAEVRPDRIEQELESEEEAAIEGGYIGKAGEHSVLSELLFRGYNSALMSVDVGIDILATKDNQTFNIQVKTRNISQTHQAFFFNLRIASFERHNAGKTFYIFVLREKTKLDYLILPFEQLEKSIEQEFVHVVGKGKLYRITLKRRNNKVYLGRKENDMTYYLNRWEIVK